MKKIARRTAIKTGFAAGFATAANVGNASSDTPTSHPTPPEIKGPFYPIIAQKDKDFDLTTIDGRNGTAKGEQIIIEGKIVDTTGQAITDVSVELWQACSSGRYNHPHDPNPAPVDPNFQGWAIVPSGEDGAFRFKTIMPGQYPAAPGWMRPPHIHFKVSKRGYVELVTQMYFPNHPLNDKDRLLQRKNDAEQALMISKEISKQPRTFRYQIVIEKA